MKKIVLFLVCVVALTACHFLDKDDEGNGTPFYYSYEYRPRGNMLDLCDITVTYYKADGTTKTDTVNSELWLKSNYFTQADVPVGYQVSLKAKDSCQYYTKDTTFNFHHYFNYALSVREGTWGYQWDQQYTVVCPITKDSLQRLLDQHFDKRGIHFYLNSNFNLTDSIPN